VANDKVEIRLPLKDILNRLGTVKNELLVFAVLVCIILNVSAYPLDKGSPTQTYGGLVMHLATIPILLLSGGFYCYAFLKLPGSAQEMVFVANAEQMLRQHRRRSRKTADKDNAPPN
jgi:hypothetical protein